MRSTLYPEYCQSRGGSVLQWRWHTADGRTVSAQAFPLFHDCMMDAKRKGHTVDVLASIAAAKSHSPATRGLHQVPLPGTTCVIETCRSTRLWPRP